MPIDVITIHTDVLVVGSGGSGVAAAEAAYREGKQVCIISKDPVVCSDSKISEGVMTVRASGSHADTETHLSNNLQVQGDDLAEPGLTRAFSRDSQQAYDWLQQNNIKAELDSQGQPVPLPIPMGGHTKARSIDHQNAGLDYGHALWDALYASDKVTLIEDCWMLDLYQLEGRIYGGLAYSASRGQLLSIRATATILACGGLSTLYFPHTDTMRGNTGDAYAIAWRAGAQLLDMEQVQFIPFAITHPKAYQGLIVGEPVVGGIRGKIRDSEGKLLLGELMGRTRAECAEAMARALAAGKGTAHQGCYLDLTDNARGRAGKAYVELMQAKIPGILKLVRATMGRESAQFEKPWEVAPSAHYFMGGVRCDDVGRVYAKDNRTMQGFYAAGQALGGLHGSNRLGSTSLAEAIIFGRRAGQHAAQLATKEAHLNLIPQIIEQDLIDHYQSLLRVCGITSAGIISLQRQLQQQAWTLIGPSRTDTGMKQFLNFAKELEKQLQEISATRKDSKKTVADSSMIWNQPFIDLVETRNLLDCARMIASSGLERGHSLGAHVQLDRKRPFWHRPESLVCSRNPDKTISISRLSRKASPIPVRIQIKGQQAAKLLLFKLINRMPEAMQDRILLKIYSRAGANTNTPEMTTHREAQA